VNFGLLIALAGMSGVAVALLLAPLLRHPRLGEKREAYNLAVYRDQLAELGRDRDRGLLTAEQAAAARAEIGRRMLALTPAAADPARSSSALSGVAAAAIAMLPVAALLLYWRLGAPGIPDLPSAGRGGAETPAAGATPPGPDMQQAIARLSDHLKQDPGDLKGWLLLARAEQSVGEYKKAAEGYRHAADLSGQRPEILGDYGEALVMAADGDVTPDARRAFEAELDDPETAPRARYYLALAELQHGHSRAALQAWVDLEADSPADAEWLGLLRRRIADTAAGLGLDAAALKTSSGGVRKAAGGPEAGQAPPPAGEVGAAKAIAEASPEDRRHMIEAMVAGLAARLQQHPEDGAGWARLGRSYMVLNQPENAREAFARAVELAPDSAPLKLAYAEAIIAAAGDTAGPPAAATALLREVLRADPENREALWYVGLAEAAAGNPEGAQAVWRELLAQLPADAPERGIVERRLAGLKFGDAK